MSILSLAGVKASVPFCDSLDLTFPADVRDEVRAALVPFLISIGGSAATDGLWYLPRVCSDPAMQAAIEAMPKSKQRRPSVKLDSVGQVFRVSFSGGAASAFRMGDCWASMLATLWQFPHTVTRLDATVDFREHAPPLVRRVLLAARSSGINLGRKAVRAPDTLFFEGTDLRGEETGTVYLGKPGREIRLKVYDKRHEIESHGGGDMGPCLRAELALRKVGATLRDAVDPSALFWNYASAVIVAPLDAPAWVRGETGFALPPPGERDYWQLLQRRVEGWVDLQELKKISEKLGPYGPRMLLGLLARSLGLPGLPDGYTAARLGV